MYDIFKRRVYRHFSIRNPEYKQRDALSRSKSKDISVSQDLDKLINDLNDGRRPQRSPERPGTPSAKNEGDNVKPFLELSLEDLRGFEIAPRGSFIVFNAGGYVFIHPLVVHEKLIKVMRPHYTTQSTTPDVAFGMKSGEMSSSMID